MKLKSRKPCGAKNKVFSVLDGSRGPDASYHPFLLESGKFVKKTGGITFTEEYLTGKNLRSLNSQATGERENITQEKRSMGKRIGTKLGKVADTKGRVVDKAKDVKQQVKDIPVQARYAVHSSKEKAKENMADVKRGIVETKGSKQAERQSKAQKRPSTTSEGIKRDFQSATERKQSTQDRNNNNININKGRKK